MAQDARATHSGSAPGWIGALTGKPWFWVAAIALLLAWPIVRTVAVALPSRLAVLGALDDFTLTDQTGQAYGSEQLRGKVWVATFISTRCPTACPAVTERVAEIRHRTRNLVGSFQLVSFTVDRDHDTPEVLASYAAKHRASARMSFVTGDLTVIGKAVIRALRASGHGEGPDALGHHAYFMLVDRKMRIRALHRAGDPGAVDKLVRGVSVVIARG